MQVSHQHTVVSKNIKPCSCKIQSVKLPTQDLVISFQSSLLCARFLFIRKNKDRQSARSKDREQHAAKVNEVLKTLLDVIPMTVQNCPCSKATCKTVNILKSNAIRSVVIKTTPPDILFKTRVYWDRRNIETETEWSPRPLFMEREPREQSLQTLLGPVWNQCQGYFARAWWRTAEVSYQWPRGYLLNKVFHPKILVRFGFHSTKTKTFKSVRGGVFVLKNNDVTVIGCWLHTARGTTMVQFSVFVVEKLPLLINPGS